MGARVEGRASRLGGTGTTRSLGSVVPRPGNGLPAGLGPRPSPLPRDLPRVHRFVATGSNREQRSFPPTK
eukprot:994408-Pyramimonas_sp.AAC.1